MKSKESERYNKLTDQLKDWERTKANYFDEFYRQSKQIEANDGLIRLNATLQERSEKISDLKTELLELRMDFTESERIKRDREALGLKEHGYTMDMKKENQRLKQQYKMLLQGRTDPVQTKPNPNSQDEELSIHFIRELH